MWKGFLIESKSYMGYPKCGRVKFWKQFPAAAIRFYGIPFKHWLFVVYNKPTPK